MLAVLAFSPVAASADWLITPFIGSTFAGRTVLVTFEQGASSPQWIVGGSGGWLTDGVIGFEADFAYAPGFYESDTQAPVIANSHLISLTGNVIITLPLSVTRESLRPYLIGGLGVIDGHIDPIANPLPELLPEPAAALNIGGGVIGFITENTGVRFDLRHVRSLARDETLLGAPGTKLRFWRLTAGVSFRR